jgi:hypothetical protein
MSFWPTCTPSASLTHQVGAVVEDERHAAGAAHRLVAPGHTDDLAVVGVLEAQLHEIDAAPQRPLEECVGARVADEVEPSGVDGGAEVRHGPQSARTREARIRVTGAPLLG